MLAGTRPKAGSGDGWRTDYVIDEMISAKAIAARVEALAREIAEFYAGTDKLVVIGLLRGSFVFIADLVRELAAAGRGGLPGGLLLRQRDAVQP